MAAEAADEQGEERGREERRRGGAGNGMRRRRGAGGSNPSRVSGGLWRRAGRPRGSWGWRWNRGVVSLRPEAQALAETDDFGHHC